MSHTAHSPQPSDEDLEASLTAWGQSWLVASDSQPRFTSYTECIMDCFPSWYEGELTDELTELRILPKVDWETGMRSLGAYLDSSPDTKQLRDRFLPALQMNGFGQFLSGGVNSSLGAPWVRLAWKLKGREEKYSRALWRSAESPRWTRMRPAQRSV